MKISLNNNISVDMSISSIPYPFTSIVEWVDHIKYGLNLFTDTYEVIERACFTEIHKIKLVFEYYGLCCTLVATGFRDWYKLVVWKVGYKNPTFVCNDCCCTLILKEDSVYEDLCYSCMDKAIFSEKENQYDAVESQCDYIDNLIETYWFETDCLQWAINEIISTIPLVDVSWYSEYAIGQATLLENRWVELTESLDKPDDQLDYLEESLMGYV